ncbi:MAG: hypothetical protein JWQ09_1758 [Segetibacter sp.]|nr:hypothetical protein [Segetibacter sp.]
MKRIIFLLRKIHRSFYPHKVIIISKEEKIQAYLAANSIPWSDGYHEYKWMLIEQGINDQELLKKIKNIQLPIGYGKNVDERVIEYPWLVAHIPLGGGKFLDAGSTFNFNELLQVPVLQNKDIYIYTFYPESNNFSKDRISYVYGDLRELPFKNNFFDQIVCHSTLEHIDMDNSIYGYELTYEKQRDKKSYDYLKVIKELERVLKPGGKLLLTFPFGEFENHDFFQQFDAEMVQKMTDAISMTCTYKKQFAKYEIAGWRFATEDECNDAKSYNPHTGKGKGDDNAAHSRAICFIEILKKD